MVTNTMVLSRLPQFIDKWELITPEQYVPDIIREVCAAHRLFGRYYDLFSYLFYTTDPGILTENLYRFCKRYITYREESVEFQSSSVPQGILTRGVGDCKHFAIFSAGVIGSLNRTYGCCFDAKFKFVGYGRAKEPYHVFVSVKDSRDNSEIWLDPTPGSGGMPTLIIEKPV